MNVKEVDLLRRSGPTLRWRTWSSETSEPSPLTISLTFDGSVSSFTLNRTMCSTVFADVILIKDLVEEPRCLVADKVTENEWDNGVLRHSIVSTVASKSMLTVTLLEAN